MIQVAAARSIFKPDERVLRLAAMRQLLEQERDFFNVTCPNTATRPSYYEGASTTQA